MQHFLLTSAARTMSLKAIFRMTDAEAFEAFKALRWEDGAPSCPHCGSCGLMYVIEGGMRWKCSDCRKKFSITSGTIFAHHKLPLQDYLAALAIFSNGAKGHAALQMSRELDVQYKTAFVLTHKIREAIINGMDLEQMTGNVEIDGSYFGGHIKPANVKAERMDRRLVKNQNGKRHCVIAIRERNTDAPGARRTFVFTIKNENQLDVGAFALESIDADAAVVHADQHIAYDKLNKHFTIRRVNHSVQYSDFQTGGCINQCESYFARLERCIMGQHHHTASKYLIQYASEIAFREDFRRQSNGATFQEMTRRAMRSPVSKEWCGYWQGNHRVTDGLDSLDVGGWDPRDLN